MNMDVLHLLTNHVSGRTKRNLFYYSSRNGVCQREDYNSPRSASLPPDIVLSRSQNARKDLRESADGPTKDDDIGFSSRNEDKGRERVMLTFI